MNTSINYDDYDFKNNDFKNNIDNTLFKLTNIKLIDKPSIIIHNNIEYTLLKIICKHKNKKI